MKLRIFIEPQQGADYQTQRAVALAAEELGFDAFFRSDHYLAMGGSGCRDRRTRGSRWAPWPSRPAASGSGPW